MIVQLTRKFGGAFAIAALLASSAAADNTGHDTQMACYASVHTECYGNGQSNCSEEVYNEGLDECDAGYGKSRPHSGPFALTVPSKTQRVLVPGAVRKLR